MAFFSMIKIFLLCTASLSLLLATPASGQRNNHLLTGEVLFTNLYLIEGIYDFSLLSDCNFVLYKDDEQIWESQTSYSQDLICYVIMRSDGNLVIIDDKIRLVWTSNSTGEKGEYVFLLQKDGNAVIHGKPIWATGTDVSASVVIKPALNGTVGAYGGEQNKVGTYEKGENHLLAGESLNTGESLIQGDYRLTIQRDCNLVLYRYDKPIWDSKTSNSKGLRCNVTLQTDGNLVIYGNENRAIWASDTAGEKGEFVFLLQKDGNAVIYSKSTWSTGTGSNGSASVVIKPALNGTVERNKLREMGKISEVKSDE